MPVSVLVVDEAMVIVARWCVDREEAKRRKEKKRKEYPRAACVKIEL